MPEILPIIYLVDDDAMIRKLLESIIMSAFQVRVVSFDNAQIALKQAKNERPNLIILDLNMPAMNGQDALRVLRSAPETEKIPVIICTVESQEKIVRDLMENRIEGYILKPFEPEAIIDKIVQITGLASYQTTTDAASVDDKAMVFMLIGNNLRYKSFVKKALKKSFNAVIIDALDYAAANTLLQNNSPAAVLSSVENETESRNNFVSIIDQCRHRSIPIIACPGEVSQEFAQEIIQLGISDIILKPFTEKRLLDKVRKCLPHKL